MLSGLGLTHLLFALFIVGLVGALAYALWRARQVAERDILTGVLTRTGLLRRLRPGTPFSRSVLLLDLNGLKAVNDSRGHAEGDAHLRRVVGALRAVLPPRALLARWGGDEFVAVLPGPTEAAERVAVRALMAAPSPGMHLPAFAFGVAPLVDAGAFEQAFALADAHLYDRKQERRAADASAVVETHALDSVALRISALREPEEVLHVGLDLLDDLLGFDRSAYWERDGAVWRESSWRSRAPGAELATEAFGLSQIVARAVIGGASAWSTDYPADRLAQDRWVEAGLKSVLVTPVLSDGAVVGLFVCSHVTGWRTVTPQLRRVAETVSLRLGHALDMRRVANEVRVALEGGLLALGAALEARDLETAGHTERVVALSESLGRALGLRGADLDTLRQGAYLHDIGKLAIPDAILLKRGALSEAEWAVMRSHALLGAAMVARIPSLPPSVRDVVRAHHERWDGTGYPDGLAGEAIPLLARLFAVVDVYDALTSERPYKPAWPHARALAELRAGAGKQFDPRIVEAFAGLWAAGMPQAVSRDTKP